MANQPGQSNQVQLTKKCSKECNKKIKHHKGQSTEQLRAYDNRELNQARTKSDRVT